MFRPTRRHFGVLLAVGAFAAPAAAQQTRRHDVNLDTAGAMIHGHDPVAYFTLGKPTKGLATITATHAGGTYWFATTANRDAFVKEPAKYAPQFGGFCAMGASYGKKFDGDPTQWAIVDGKLYLNVNADVAKRWAEDKPGNITRADSAWPRIKDKPAATLNAE